MSLSTGEISIENGRSLEDFNAADCADPMLVEKRQARNIAFLIMVIVPLRCDLLAEESGDRRAYPIFVVRSFVEKTGERSVCPHVIVPMLFAILLMNWRAVRRSRTAVQGSSMRHCI